jgi:hypothetical protein
VGVVGLILTLAVVWVVLTLVLAAWTLWFQGYIYNEPTPGILWRAPAAGTALVLALLVWVFFDYRAPGLYRTLIEFSPYEDSEYKQLQVVTKNRKETYQLRKNARGMNEYRNTNAGGPALPGRPDKVIVTEDGQPYTFEPDKGKSGDSTLRYLDSRGMVMLEGQLGRVRTFHAGWLLGNLLLNFVQLLAWWLCLWLLLRFQWSHALGLAVVFWGVMILLVMPLVLTKAEEVAKSRTPAGGARSTLEEPASPAGGAGSPLEGPAPPAGAGAGPTARVREGKHRGA